MNQDAIKTIGKKQTSREEAFLFMVNEIEGLVDTFDKDFPEWSDFDCWEIMDVPVSYTHLTLPTNREV